MSDSLIKCGPKRNSKEIENILNHVFDSNMEIKEKYRI